MTDRLTAPTPTPRQQIMPPPGAYTPCRLLVVTGPPGVGKTTLVTRVAKEFAANVPHVQVAGFWTEEVRQDGQRVGFDIVTLGEPPQRAVLARVAEQSAAPEGSPRVGKYVVDVAGFEALALPCLAAAAEGTAPQLLLVDELGKMEACSEPFVAALEKTLATSCTRGRVSLMTVAQKGTGIIASTKARRKCSRSFCVFSQERGLKEAAAQRTARPSPSPPPRATSSGRRQ